MIKKAPPEQIEDFKNSTATVLRTLAGLRDLEVNYSVNEPPIGRLPPGRGSRLPSPDRDLSVQSKILIRGCADIQGFYRAYHSEKVARQYQPKDFASQELFNALEKTRCEALGALDYKGAAVNISQVHQENYRRLGYTEAIVKDQTELKDVLPILAYKSFTGEEPSSIAAHVLKEWEIDFSEHGLEQKLRELTGSLHNQKVFAQQACEILGALGYNVPSFSEGDDAVEETTEHSNEADSDADTSSQAEQDTKETQEQTSQTSEDMDESYDMPDAEGDTAEYDPTEEDGDDAQAQSGVPEIRFEGFGGDIPHGHYKVFTTQFDEEIEAEELADSIELNRLRRTLDQYLATQQSLIARLANRLQRKLLAAQRRSWKFDVEEGVVDGSRLARVIANPTVPITFKRERDVPFKDTVVSLLIDNSGSMRGRPIATAAMTADIITRTLERCGIKVEILGFTTRAWKGGASRELWVEQGRPANPGRLNDIRHIIYKHADSPMRRAKKNLGLMLKEGLLKENIDGEALVWAHNRLNRRPEERKIMIVISDGAPVDDSTLACNPANILELDLRVVIGWIQERSPIELAAIGIGHDVTRYYDKAITIPDVDGLADALIEELENIFEGH